MRRAGFARGRLTLSLAAKTAPGSKPAAGALPTTHPPGPDFAGTGVGKATVARGWPSDRARGIMLVPEVGTPEP